VQYTAARSCENADSGRETGARASDVLAREETYFGAVTICLWIIELHLFDLLWKVVQLDVGLVYVADLWTCLQRAVQQIPSKID